MIGVPKNGTEIVRLVMMDERRKILLLQRLGAATTDERAYPMKDEIVKQRSILLCIGVKGGRGRRIAGTKWKANHSGRGNVREKREEGESGRKRGNGVVRKWGCEEEGEVRASRRSMAAMMKSRAGWVSNWVRAVEKGSQMATGGRGSKVGGIIRFAVRRDTVNYRGRAGALHTFCTFTSSVTCGHVRLPCDAHLASLAAQPQPVYHLCDEYESAVPPLHGTCHKTPFSVQFWGQESWHFSPFGNTPTCHNCRRHLPSDHTPFKQTAFYDTTQNHPLILILYDIIANPCHTHLS